MAQHFSPDGLRRWVDGALHAAGARPEHAAITASVLVRTSLRGVDFDGDGGLGQAIATHAVEQAVSLAQANPFVPCLIRNSGHLAAIGLFVLQAAERGMVALLCQETPPIMAPEGARRSAIGNNPLSFAIPVSGRPSLVFDMATSVVARGKVVTAARAKKPIPQGWAIGPDGQHTTNPLLALQGAMLPIAGHKGIGLAMLVQCLAGSLTGSQSAITGEVDRAGSVGSISAFLLIVNPERLLGRTAFDANVTSWLSTYLCAFDDGARYPGQRAAECEAARSRSGIPLDANAMRVLVEAGELAGRSFDLNALS